MNSSAHLLRDCEWVAFALFQCFFPDRSKMALLIAVTATKINRVFISRKQTVWVTFGAPFRHLIFWH